LKMAGYDKAYLCVLEQNRRARRFYERRDMAAAAAQKTVTIGGEKLTELAYEMAL